MSWVSYFTVIVLFIIQSCAAQGQKDYFLNEDFDDENVLVWCTVNKQESEKCQDFANAMANADIQRKFGMNVFRINCIQVINKDYCMDYLDGNKADLTTLDPGEMFIGGRYHSLIPIMQEVYKGGETSYYAVAVIKRNTLPNLHSLSDLRGTNSCFAGVGTLAGWVVPIYTLMNKGVMPVVDCNNHVKSAISFFGSSCAVNSLTDKYNPLGDNSDELCRLCGTDSPTERCSSSDPYAGFEGAFRCLVEKGQVAFLKHNTVDEMLSRSIDFQGVDRSSFELFCPDGSRSPLESYHSCNWGKVPSHAIVTSSAKPFLLRVKYQKFLEKALQVFSSDLRSDVNSSSDSFSSYNYLNSDFHLFDSAPKYGTRRNLMFQDTTIAFLPLPENSQTFKHYLGTALDMVLGIRQCPVNRMTLCVVSDAELSKCVKMKDAQRAQLLKPEMSCYKGHSQINCMQAIRNGEADVAVFDAGDIYTAGYRYGLIPIISEVYNLEKPEFYAVAVALLGDPDTDLTYLKNKNTCHTGIEQGAGWVLPLAYLLSSGRMRGYGCDSLKAASQYFTKSCVPGALNTEYVLGNPQDNLCDLCRGAGASYCQRSSAETYYGHMGAFRCLVEGGGHVAFVKHTTVAEVTDGKREEWWARNTLASDYELLCRDGTRAPVTEYERCNLGRVKANAVVTRGADGYNEAEVHAFINLFIYTQQYFGRKLQDDFGFSLYYSPPPYSDLIFQDATKQLQEVPLDQQNYRSYLGPDFLKARALVDCRASAATHLISLLVVGVCAAAALFIGRL